MLAPIRRPGIHKLLLPILKAAHHSSSALVWLVVESSHHCMLCQWSAIMPASVVCKLN